MTDSVPQVDDYAASVGTTGRVTVGGSATGEIQSTRHVPLPGYFNPDIDWFAVELEAGKAYRIEIRGADTGDGTLLDPSLVGIYDAKGELIDGTGNNNGGEGRNSRTVFEPDSSGTYYVAAYGIGNGTYTVAVDEVPLPSDDYAASVSTTGTVAVGGSVTGEIEKPGDRDWFAVELEAGKTYRIEVKGVHSESGTLRAPLLAGIYDADGAYVDGTRNSGSGVLDDSLGFFAPDTAGTYHVAVEALARREYTTGTYTVAVKEVPEDDYAASVATTGTVAVAGSVTGEIERHGDRDWFAVELEAGKGYVIRVKGADTEDGTLRDPFLVGLYDAAGEFIAGTANDDGGWGRNSMWPVTPDTSGTYYVAAGAFGRDLPTGTYTVTVDVNPNYRPPTPPAEADDAGQQAPSDAGDVYFQGTGETGGTLAADTLAGTAGADAIDCLAGNDVARGLGGDDRLWGRQGADILYGNAGSDRLWGGRDGDELHGGVGKDHLYGGLGHDTLYGGRGDDMLHGGRLADRLHGGEGKDVLVGGHGRDLFVYDDADFGRDRIVDFEDGLDRLDFTGSGLRWSDLSVSNNGKGHAVVRVDGANGKIVLEGVDASLIGQDDFIF